jgi:chemotaxis protein CheX
MSMSIHDLIVDRLNHACANVCSTMLGVELIRGEVTTETSTPEPNDGVVSLIGLAGSWTGTGSISCSPALACRICAHMLMTEVAAVNEEVLDAVAELTNMIIGSVKTDLEQHLGPLGLSLPTVVFGRNFKTRSLGSAEWIIERFRWDDEELVVKFTLAQSERTAHARLHTFTPCTLDV